MSWTRGGADGANGNVCTVQMTSNKTITATFTANSCTFAISPTKISFTYKGGSVTDTNDCEWKAQVDGGSASWLSIDSGNMGTGDGTVTFAVSGNSTSKTRTGKINAYLAGSPTKRKVFTVTQKK